MKYIVEEKQNLQSYRKGKEIDVINLRQAKIKASREQAFFGTVLVVKSINGNELSCKENGRWVDLF